MLARAGEDFAAGGFDVEQDIRVAVEFLGRGLFNGDLLVNQAVENFFACLGGVFVGDAGGFAEHGIDLMDRDFGAIDLRCYLRRTFAGFCIIAAGERRGDDQGTDKRGQDFLCRIGEH